MLTRRARRARGSHGDGETTAADDFSEGEAIEPCPDGAATSPYRSTPTCQGRTARPRFEGGTTHGESASVTPRATGTQKADTA